MFVIALLLSLALNQAAPEGTGRVSGRVTLDQTNTPVSGASVALYLATSQSAAGRMPAPTTTDEDGRYTFANVPPGSYNVTVQKSGLVPLSLGDPQSAVAQPPVVHVSSGQSLEGVDQRLQKGAIISGRLLDAKGEPLPEVPVNVERRVTLVGHPAMLLPVDRSGYTNDLGEFRISGLASGEYLVAATPRPSRIGGRMVPTPTTAPRTMPARTFYPGTTDEAAAQLLTVTAGNELTNISFTVQSVRTFRVSGIVVNEDGNPVANVTVSLNGDPTRGNFAPEGTWQSDSSGRFTIGGVLPGSYRLHALPIITPRGTSDAGTGGSRNDASGGVAPPPFAVTDADVSDLRVVARRLSRQ
jgi:Carboxypeptidase regulatory-like domain